MKTDTNAFRVGDAESLEIDVSDAQPRYTREAWTSSQLLEFGEASKQVSACGLLERHLRNAEQRISQLSMLIPL